MQRVVLLKNYNGNKAGDTIAVSNNVALGLVERDIGVLEKNYKTSQLKSPQDKMMRPEKSGIFTCDECDRGFNTKRGLSVHKTKVHQNPKGYKTK